MWFRKRLKTLLHQTAMFEVIQQRAYTERQQIESPGRPPRSIFYPLFHIVVLWSVTTCGDNLNKFTTVINQSQFWGSKEFRHFYNLKLYTKRSISFETCSLNFLFKLGNKIPYTCISERMIPLL
jgi:hypothetical protein